MKRFDSTAEYHGFVADVAAAEREMTADLQSEEQPTCDDGYAGAENEYSIAHRVIAAPRIVEDETTVTFNGEPYVKTRADPISVFLHSDRTDAVPDELIEDNRFHRAAVAMFAHDLKEELILEAE